MDRLILEDYRCFTGQQSSIPIRPLTLLVGENSTGKTSFLAAVRAAYDLRRSRADMRSFETVGTPDFNEDPFHLGSYDQIANYRAGPAGRAKSFLIGQQFMFDRRLARRRHSSIRRASRGKTEMQITARFTAVRSQPTLSEFCAVLGEYKLVMSGHAVLSLSSSDRVILERRERDESARYPVVGNIMLDLFAMRHEGREETTDNLTRSDRDNLDDIIDAVLFNIEQRPYAFAPIRTSPQRTYDPIKEVRDPEGSHIPMMLARLLDNGGSPEFREHLEGFGEASGLYSSIGIRRVGRKDSDPFQIEVKHPHGGPWRNLVDVGYGVSQAIPIIADAVSTEPGTMLLIQQPEVHLHPRAQAAMGSFFARLAERGRNRLVVETHSDYLVDRVRMDVRDERIKADDVVILYFEQAKGGVVIHPIDIDASGNLSGVPDGYRRFFLEEQRRFFGVD